MPVNPSWRSLAGMFLIVALILGWSVLVVTLAGRAGNWPWPLELLFYLVAGIAWILPLKPVIRWMQRGRSA
ncbi:DUF2842 domain-containing protein [Sphingosinicella terrae]|uniref:DUF2842 domain-containing protein n=1 Tax=Sphingosinicella terrae TaxID=2172047 RepID=UPI0032D96BFE